MARDLVGYLCKVVLPDDPSAPRKRGFRSSVAESQTEKDSMAERGGFEPSVPRGLLRVQPRHRYSR